MRIIIATLIFLAGSGVNTSYAFTLPSSTTKTKTQLSSYNDEYYRDYSNNANYNNNNYNNRDNYVVDRNSGRFDNSVGSATYQLNSYGGGGADSNSGFGGSRDYRSYDNYNSNDYYRGGGGSGSRNNLYSSPYGRVGSSEDFRLTRRGGWGSDNMRRGIYGSNNRGGRRMRDYNYGTTIGDDYYNDNYYNSRGGGDDGYYGDNYVLQNRRGGYADDIGGRSRYSTPLYTSGGYYNTQGLSEDFRVGREGPMSSITSRQRRMRNVYNTNRIQDYYTPGERELMAQRDGNYGLRYGWQQQYNRDRGNVRRGSGEDFRRGSALNRISDYFTPLERERRQMRDNRESMGRRYDNGRGYSTTTMGGSRRDYDGGSSRRVGGYYEDYPDYGFDDDYYQDEYDDYFDDDGGYSSGSRRRGRNGRRDGGGAWSNLFNMFRN